LSAAGKLTANKAELTELTVKTKATFNNSCAVKVEGKMGINTSVPSASSKIDLAVQG
jgi:hypothetical protein